MNYGSSSQRSLFYRMPYFAKNIFASLYGLEQRYLRYGRHFRKHLRMLERSQYWTFSQLRQFQDEKIGELLEAAVRHVPYYQSEPRYQRALKSTDLHDVPVLSKQTVRSHMREMYNRSITDVRWAHTSGTTGKALQFPISMDCFQREYAFRELHLSWSGSTFPGDRVAFCQGHPVAYYNRERPPFWIRDFATGSLMMSSYHMSERNLSSYVAELERFKPDLLWGYPSSIYLLAKAYRRYGTGLLKIRAVYTASESVLDFQRREVSASFNCRLFDWYGNSEMCANIVECEYGERHLKLEHSFVEVLDEAGYPVGPGGSGRLVCTGFGNRAFPLIRYEIGDVVKLSAATESKCGRAGTLVDHVFGRVEDYVIAADGRLVGRLDHLFKDSTNIVEAQIVQRESGVVILRIVRTSEYGKRDEDAVRKEAELRLGSNTKIAFEYVNAIPRSANGKFRFIDSSLQGSGLRFEIGNCADTQLERK